MVAERSRSDEEIAKIASMVVQGLFPQLQKTGQDDKREEKEFKTKEILDEKYFRRMEKFSGDMSGYRMWIFNVTVALGQ
eukprot:1664918-Karenia_brevis.AAC.1